MKPISEKNITIKEVARQANVSKTTVSRVLNGHPYVSKKIRQRVLKIIEKMNYHPNVFARGLSKGGISTIGIILPEIDSGFFSELLKNIEENAKKENIFLLTSFAKNGNISEILSKFSGSKVCRDVILLSPELKKREIEKYLIFFRRIILIGKNIKSEKIYNIKFENYKNSWEITKHLISHKYRKIGIIKGPEKNIDAVERFNGFKDAIIDSGLKMEEKYLLDGDFTEESGYEAGKKLYKKKLPEAVFCCNDAMAIGLIEFLKEKGIKVPEDVAVAGFDGIKAGEYFSLTTVKIPLSKLSKYAFLLATGKEKGDKILRGEILIRNSCGCKKRREK